MSVICIRKGGRNSDLQKYNTATCDQSKQLTSTVGELLSAGKLQLSISLVPWLVSTAASKRRAIGSSIPNRSQKDIVCGLIWAPG